ncbi:hypothetical protein B0H14DRAFT_3535844 [Mycena olivaceomarginata]|nr:hypothetical protein B0H14DRAFT_3535844 [Mycena olivaceomarginata]
MQSTEPGALTWLHFDNLECRQLCRLFDATEVAQMEDRLIMAIAREAAPYFRDFRDRAFSIDPSIEPTEDNPYPIDEFYCTPLLWVHPTSEHRALVCSTYGANATAFNSDFQIPHVEEADRKVGDAEDAAGDESGSELGALRPGSSARLTRKTQPAPSSTTKAEDSSKSASASTSKPGGTIHVKKEGAASVKTPATPKPSHAQGGLLQCPFLFDGELLPDSSSKTSRKRPQVEIYTQGRPPSVETEQLEQKPPKRGRDPEASSSAKLPSRTPGPFHPLGSAPCAMSTLLPISRWSRTTLWQSSPTALCPTRTPSPAVPARLAVALANAKSLNSACDYCTRGGQVSVVRLLPSSCLLLKLGGTWCRHYAMLARAAHNFDRLCTEVVVLFNHQSSVLPLSHLEQMFEDPEDIQMLRELSERAAEASSKRFWRRCIATNGR